MRSWCCNIVMAASLMSCASPEPKGGAGYQENAADEGRPPVAAAGSGDAGCSAPQKPWLRREYYRDTLPYAIEIEDSPAAASQPSCLSSHFAGLFSSKIDGSLIGRTVRYITPECKSEIRIDSQGAIAISAGDSCWLSGRLTEDSLHKRKVIIEQCSQPGKAGTSASFYINGQQVTVPAFGISIYYDALEMDFINLKCFGSLFLFDIRYNTDNNFAHVQLYPEPICWMRYVAARDLMASARHFLDMGLKIKVFDAYRPRDVQYRMWDVVPDPRFVANPKTGSIHNRGGAVDLTLVDSDGEDLDMGTDFDFFGVEAYPSCRTIPAKAQENRKLLSSIITQHHFKAITSEWWHFSHTTARSLPLSSFVPRERLDLR